MNKKGGKATITHYPDDFAVISEADSEGKRVVYLRFVGELIGKMSIEAAAVDLQFALEMDDVIKMILEFQTAAAWFHKLMTEADKARVEEAIRITDEAAKEHAAEPAEITA